MALRTYTQASEAFSLLRRTHQHCAANHLTGITTHMEIAGTLQATADHPDKYDAWHPFQKSICVNCFQNTNQV